jgi:hypothetical protein
MLMGHLRHVQRLAAAASLAVGITLVGGVTQSALACGAGLCPPGGSSSTPTESGHTVTVQVSGSFVGGGSDGSPGGGSTTVSVPSPCWYTQGWSGKEYYKFVKSGDMAGLEYHTGEQMDTYPDYESHKDDADGHYYGGECSSETFGDDLDGFFTFSEAWFKDHKTVWVPGGQQPPAPPVPPKVLLRAAQQAMTIPEPTFDWNPKATDGGASLVNLDTWFWLDHDIANGSVTAAAGGNSVTVTAARQSVTFEAPSAGAVDCADGGVAWSAGAHSSCVLYFRQASAGTPVTASSHWGLSWTANGQPQGQLDPIDANATAPVRVIEVQTPVVQAR